MFLNGDSCYSIAQKLNAEGVPSYHRKKFSGEVIGVMIRQEKYTGCTLAQKFYDDFVRRVHKCRTNPHLSQQVQKCVDYIEMNLDKKIRAADIAALVGYTEYYLTHKFKEETGLSVTDYIKFAKIERAKVLLKSTDQTVQDIATALSFSTRNYFSRIFQEVTGQTPMEYREK